MKFLLFALVCFLFVANEFCRAQDNEETNDEVECEEVPDRPPRRIHIIRHHRPMRRHRNRFQNLDIDVSNDNRNDIRRRNNNNNDEDDEDDDDDDDNGRIFPFFPPRPFGNLPSLPVKTFVIAPGTYNSRSAAESACKALSPTARLATIMSLNELRDANNVISGSSDSGKPLWIDLQSGPDNSNNWNWQQKTGQADQLFWVDGQQPPSNTDDAAVIWNGLFYDQADNGGNNLPALSFSALCMRP